MTTTTGACTTGACTTGACNTKAPARRFAPRVPRPVDDDVAQVVRRGACPPRCRSAPSLARPGTLRSRLARAALWRFAACPSFALCVVDVACSSSCTRVFDWTVDRQDGQPPRPPGGPRGWLMSLSPRLSRPNNQSASFCPKVASRRPTDCVRGARYAPARPAAAWASERMGAVVARRGVIGQDIAAVIDATGTTGTNCRE